MSDTAQLGADLARHLAPYLPPADIAPAVQAALRAAVADPDAGLTATTAAAIAAVAAVLPPPYATAVEVGLAVGRTVAAWWERRVVEVEAGSVTVTDHR